MANPSKAQILSDIQALLKKRYKLEPPGTTLNVLESVIYAICRENATVAQADQAFAKFKSDFFDWNEVRVSTIDEIRAVFKGMADDEERAQKLRRFLRQLFEKTYGFNLEALVKKPLKDSLKTLSEYEAFQSDYIVAEVSRIGLGGHAIGLDRSILRLLDRLCLGATDGDIAALRGSIERAVPKNRGAEFAILASEVAADVCVEGPPKCSACELKKLCPTALGTAPKPTPPPPPAAGPSDKKSEAKKDAAKKDGASKQPAKKPEAKAEATPPPAPPPPAPDREKGKAPKSKAAPLAPTPPPPPPIPEKQVKAVAAAPAKSKGKEKEKEPEKTVAPPAKAKVEEKPKPKAPEAKAKVEEKPKAKADEKPKGKPDGKAKAKVVEPPVKAKTPEAKPKAPEAKAKPQPAPAAPAPKAKAPVPKAKPKSAEKPKKPKGK